MAYKHVFPEITLPPTLLLIPQDGCRLVTPRARHLFGARCLARRPRGPRRVHPFPQERQVSVSAWSDGVTIYWQCPSAPDGLSMAQNGGVGQTARYGTSVLAGSYRDSQ